MGRVKPWEFAEKLTAEKFKGKRSPSSGGLEVKGDVQNDKYLIEVKQTDKKSYSLKLETLEKVAREALQFLKTGIMVIHFSDDKRYVVLPEKDFLFLLGEDESI